MRLFILLVLIAVASAAFHKHAATPVKGPSRLVPQHSAKVPIRRDLPVIPHETGQVTAESIPSPIRKVRSDRPKSVRPKQFDPNTFRESLIAARKTIRERHEREARSKGTSKN